ncbi:MAG: hypothetical protein ACPGTU_13940, partial [Myxococcota bacterium]
LRQRKIRDGLQRRMYIPYSFEMRIGIFTMFVLGCTAPELAPSGIEFVRDGVIVDGGIGADGELLNDGRELLIRDWQVGESLEIRGRNGRAVGIAPDAPTCSVLWQVEIGSSSMARLAFSADDSILKITGSETKEEGRNAVQTLDGWRGVAVTETPAQWSSRDAGLPQACMGSVTVVRAIVSGDGYRFAAIEGPVSEGAEKQYRVTMYR